MNKTLKIAIASLTLAALVATVGCNQTVFNLQAAAADVQLAADIGVYYALSQDAKTRPIFTAVTVALDTLIAHNTTSATDLENAILPLVGNDPNVKLAVMAAVGLYEANFASAVTSGIASNNVAAALLPALNNGIKQALSQPAGQKSYRLAARK